VSLAHEPYRNCSLFEFSALYGSVNEVDTLPFATCGFFLVEINSRPDHVSGDANTWTLTTDGRLASTDNLLKLIDHSIELLSYLAARETEFKTDTRQVTRQRDDDRCF